MKAIGPFVSKANVRGHTNGENPYDMVDFGAGSMEKVHEPFCWSCRFETPSTLEIIAQWGKCPQYNRLTFLWRAVLPRS